MNVLIEWKKVTESDLEALIIELEEFISSPALVILTGDVGAGKTTFTKSFAKVLANESMISSPTYSVVNEFGPLVHADFYRLKSVDDLVHLELEMYLEDAEYFLVEWGGQYYRDLLDFIPDSFHHYEILIEMSAPCASTGESTRNIRLIKLLEK